MRSFGRDLRVSDFIRDELARIVQFEMRDPRIPMLSVNDASVSRDLSWVDVYVSSFETTTEAERAALIEVLNEASGYFRSELAKRHSMRTTPKPRFHYDETVESGPKLEALIDRAIKADEEAHARSDGELEGG